MAAQRELEPMADPEGPRGPRTSAGRAFNENFVDRLPDNPDYLARADDIKALDTVLAEPFGQCDGIKVLSYQLDEEQLRHSARTFHGQPRGSGKLLSGDGVKIALPRSTSRHFWSCPPSGRG
jgi:hypothetical protein